MSESKNYMDYRVSFSITNLKVISISDIKYCMMSFIIEIFIKTYTKNINIKGTLSIFLDLIEI
jgi:hypothetical protein